MKIYAGNLSYNVTEDDLRVIFEKYGTVDSVSLITDRATGRSKGFAFVEMPSIDEANKAVLSLNEFELKGRKITVNEAQPKSNSKRSGFDSQSKGRGGFSSINRGYSGGSKGGYGSKSGGRRGDR